MRAHVARVIGIRVPRRGHAQSRGDGHLRHRPQIDFAECERGSDGVFEIAFDIKAAIGISLGELARIVGPETSPECQDVLYDERDRGLGAKRHGAPVPQLHPKRDGRLMREQLIERRNRIRR